MKARCYFLVLILMMVLVGCGKTDNPVAPNGVSDVPGSILNDGESIHSGFPPGNRILWGLWKISISADRTDVSVIPDRTGALHLNAVRLLEVAPCTDCLTFENVEILPDKVLEADVRIQHPISGNLKLTCFDVRGIFITGADYNFPACSRDIAWGDGKPRMLNPDGYTQLFNPVDYPETIPPAFGYIPGLKATGGDLTATLNPYLAYEKDQPRRMFAPGNLGTRKVRIQLVDGPLEFGYAVDGCWHPVPGEVIDPVVDFPLSANCYEAYQITTQVGDDNSLPDMGYTEVVVEVFDHQGLDTIGDVTVEAPGLFAGESPLSLSTATGVDSWLFTGTISNETGILNDEYPLLVRVTDTDSDPNLGVIDAWQITRVTVVEPQTPGWARTWGGPGSDNSSGVATVGSDCIYVCGQFEQTVDFDPGPGIDEHISNGDADVFLAKYDQAGIFLWSRTWGGPGTEYVKQAGIDSNGDIYVTGSFEEYFDFDPGDGTDIKGANGSFDTYLSKFDSNGNYIWARTWGGFTTSQSTGLCVDSQDNVYITGHFGMTTDLDPGVGIDEHTSVGSNDVYLSKIDSSGDYVWGRSWGGLMTDFGFDVTVYDSGPVYVIGVFMGSADLDPGNGTDIHVSNGEQDIFLSKFDPSGVFQWARTWGGIEAEYSSTTAVDGNGNIYASGTFRETVDFDPGAGMDEHSSEGMRDIFISKFDDFGSFQWVRVWGGVESDYAGGCVSDSLNNIYVSGSFSDEVDFDPGPGTEIHSSNGEHDVSLSKFDSSGNLLWARTWGGIGQDYGGGAGVDSSGSVYSIGRFTNEVDFDPGTGSDFHVSNGERDAFLVRFLANGNW